MHTCNGCDNRSKDKLNPDTKRFGKGLQIAFGGRKSDNWRRNCLRQELGSAVGITSEFETEIGSRYRVAMANGSALWRREDQVHDVLPIKIGSKFPLYIDIRTRPISEIFMVLGESGETAPWAPRTIKSS